MIGDLWAKIKADAVNAFALVSTALGSAMSHIDDLASFLGDPTFNDQVHQVITDAKWFGHWLLVVGIVGTVARFKHLVQSPAKGQ